MAAKDVTIPKRVRAIALEAGIPGVGSRGRISKSAYVAVFKAKPKMVKVVAEAQGISVPSRPASARAEALATLAASLT